GAFADGVACCASTTNLRVEYAAPPIREVVAAGSILGGEVLTLVLVALVINWGARPRFGQGDRLVFSGSGQEKFIPLKATQGWSPLRPHRVDITGEIRRRLPGINKNGPRSWIVRKTRDGVELNDRFVASGGKGTQIGDWAVRYISQNRTTPRPSKPPRPKPPTSKSSFQRRQATWLERLFGPKQRARPKSGAVKRSSRGT
ncbi:MAG: hypothetical protein JOZ51_08325, partial [Chloroflexi bacterium]|nr:hypothetical protein [Chloroflexota bacterium]